MTSYKVKYLGVLQFPITVYMFIEEEKYFKKKVKKKLANKIPTPLHLTIRIFY